MVAKIRALCKTKGITICALERELGIGNGVISSWDKSSPRLDNVRKVANYFGISIDELVGGEAA